MKSISRKYTDKAAVFLPNLCLSVFICGYVSVLSAFAAEPSWWSERGVINTSGAITNDYAAVNAGQVKWFATNAYDELNTKLPGGAGPAVSNLIASFTVSNNYLAVNIGQLKNVVQPFYDRLIAVGYTNAYPWTATTADDNDFAIANIGQVKNVFSFNLSGFSSNPDSDGDCMLDWWEVANGLNPLVNDAFCDVDGDGISNLQEYLSQQQSGAFIDDDHDGMADSWELQYFGGHADPMADNDGDGWNNYQEYMRDGNPTKMQQIDDWNILRLSVDTPLR